MRAVMISGEMKQMVCGLFRGHEEVLEIAKGRILVRCVSCGYQSPGWQWIEKPPAPSTPNVQRFTERLKGMV